jgi:hypothetical protein
MATNSYPVQFTVDYPDRPLNRLTSAFRIFTAIPIVIVLSALGGGSWARWTERDTWGDSTTTTTGHGVVTSVGLVVAATALMILFRQKYPRWWFDWNVNLLGFMNRVGAYLALLTDVYPATDEEQAVHLEVPYPDVQSDLGRWLPLVKWFLAIPHFIVLLVLWIGVLVCAVVAWFAILFTGRYPRGLFDYIVGVGRWGNRVAAYALIFTTDEYPPFRLAA